MLDESRVTTNKPSELTLQIPNDKANDQGDEPEPELKKNISAPNNSDNKFGDGESELFGTSRIRICSLNFLLQSADFL